MDENRDIENKIKEIFDGLNKSAPGNLWNSLSDKLPLSDTDKNIDTKIKTVFENLDKSAPPHIWETVNKQLNIDRVWKRISAELDRRPIFYLRRIVGLVIFSLLLLSGGIYLYNQKTEVFSPNTEHRTDQQKPDKNTSFISKNSFVLKEKKRYSSPPSGMERSGEANSNFKKTKESVSSVLFANKSVRKKIDSQNAHLNAGVHKKVALQNADLNSSVAENNLTKGIPESQTVASVQTFSSSAFDTLSVMIPLRLLPVNSNNAELIAISPDTTKKIDVVTIKQKKFEIGITYSHNNTWILNNETQKSFDENSLIQTSPAFAGSYGIVANYNVSKKHAISAELYVNSKYRQQYREFIEGTYSFHTLEFNYSKLTLLYQLNVNQSSFKKIPSKYTLKAGLYGSYLKNFSHSYSDIIISGTDKYAKNDYGIKLAIGQEKKFGNIIAGYGFNAEYGFKNSFAGNKYMPANFNVTKNALIGVYLNLRYNF